MKKEINIFLFILLFALTGQSQNQIIPLWKKVPNQNSSNEQEVVKVENIIRISNVQQPEIHLFLAPQEINTGKTVVICPGGGYGILAFNHEGTNFAQWLNEKGINAAVLKYRLPNSSSLITRHLAPLQDAQRAIRILRFNAEKWTINPNYIGVMGFSAGGHLASTLGTHYNYKAYDPTDLIDEISAKPNFMALIYPVISMEDETTHKGSKRNLLGETPSQELVDLFSNEKQVSTETPVTFMVHSTDDKVVPIENSLNFYKALKVNNVLTEFHVYAFGGHGYAFAKDKKQLENWTSLFYNWLQNINQ